ncbi:S-adenosyl-L-methionine-dependent methyltransferase [Colletotrichum phormii]|uniref:S-adenosyl-L-methionine-dependent methyltransferase n=1 Tax=Colletotrichum phormii TaxID=359342 RepID=A0AAJ0A4K9_9PEZI|nr:S-adenosyl-L-methionine-dependent methyltransferase [Colletotrichum phormii]KAK1656391.1 S-adenosyl-L-methionine-dependent methyltransferase [Colletotrichum phormii]
MGSFYYLVNGLDHEFPGAGINHKRLYTHTTHRILLKLYELTSKVESPWETFVGLFLSNSAVLASPLQDRLLRLLVSNNVVEMTPDGTYKPTKFCTQLADSDFGTTAEFWQIPMFTHMPTFFQETSYKNPRSARKTVFDSAHGWQGGLFTYLEANPAQGKASRLYLEDLPSVLADNKTSVSKGINKVAYDFCTPQPIKHARAYYMHHILHDWPDKQARKILEIQKAALKPGYSRILIHDQIMDDDERTEKEWRALVESAGLRVVKIWRVPAAVQGVIEVGLREGSKL